MRKIVLAVASALCLTFLTQAALADYIGYVCKVTYVKFNDSIYGDYGYLMTTFYDSPNCDGDLLGYHYFCTEGATANLCASSSTVLFTENQLLNYHTELNRAAQNGSKVRSYETASIGGTPNICSKYVTFYH